MNTVPRCCEICGSPLRRSNLAGICSTNKECLRVKMERTRHPDGRPPLNTEPPREPGEIWLPAPSPYADLYCVSNRGRVWSFPRTTSDGRQMRGRILKPWTHGICKAPKLAVTLYADKSKWPVEVHVLVMLVFAGPCPEGLEIRHLDGNAYRNWWPENLAYGTHKENGEDMALHGSSRAGQPRGSKRPTAKLTEDIVRQIRIEYAAGGVSHRTLASRYGVDITTIHCALVRKTWTHVV